ncbi:hypothetical protein PFNF54_03541 [Plasmodium falciparum NF54]|uniref:Erythrocyte membrane protein 1 n=1 Tax=Plasmodium falciparum (isolate NF54) TaxID=5843 RepID=W7JRS9_PLAFO|nr:hypothetical protein PFNF54_03541 [Plasmodium falciparum NF54]
MGPQPAVTDYSKATNVKYLFDLIGETVQKKAKEKADVASRKYFEELHGDLSKATYKKDKNPEGTTPPNPCKLEYQYHTNVTKGEDKEYPCLGRKTVRFSDKEGAECYKTKIKDSTTDTVGACAPYRRLYMCDRNLEHIEPTKITTHNLLLDVCLAAQYEGQSISQNHGKHQLSYPDSPSQLCTELARSFADIGDIVRGRDLYRGNNRENDKLEKKLKGYFKKIYDNLVEKKKEEAETDYKDDAPDFYQLREDWWALNRQDVWKAITCDAHDSRYRKMGADGSITESAMRQCRNVADVPTNFDYVPQYLRWFEEWAEDFCRKRKHKLKDAIQKCRGQDGTGKDRYCDLNRYDCKRTISAKHELVQGEECKKCSVVCIPFGPWIDNQKQEFEKQKNKYTNEINKKHDETTKEISGNRRKKRSLTTKNYKGYDEEFYKIFKDEYPDVDKFLDLLSKETACESQPYDEPRTISINFKNYKNPDIFSHTEYCQACPWCGMTCTFDGKCTKNPEELCHHKIVQKEYPDTNTTDIPILTPDTTKSNIVEKYRNFCNSSDDNNSDQINNWQCHYDESKKSGQNDNCVEGTWQNFKKDQKVTSYNAFFWKWVSEMLDDSIKWRAELDKCLKNDKKTCGKKKCNRDCKCFKKWVEQKKEKEWKAIKKHFKKQKDMIETGMPPEMALKILLNDVFLQDMEKAQGDPQHIAKIKELLKKNDEKVNNLSNMETIFDFLLQEEEQDAQKCVSNNPEKCEETQKPPTDGAPGGAGPSPDTGTDDNLEDIDSDGEEDDDVSHVDEEEPEDNPVEGSSEEEKQEVVKDTEAAVPKQDTQPKEEVNPCKIVEELFKSTKNFEDACGLKYGKNYGWKCVPTTSDKGSEPTARGHSHVARSADGAPSGDKDGAICIPPRRRKLYLHKIEGVDTTDDKSLRKWFIESAAVETFFLWDRYKKLNTPQSGSPLLGGGLPGVGVENGDDENNPEKLLQKGEIPDGFLRQMFYTLGDYRDILFSGDKDKKNGYSDIVSGDNVIKERENTIKEKIASFFQNGNKEGTPHVPKNPVQTPQTWWKDNAKHIWHGMICALTYEEKTSGSDGEKKIEKDDAVYKKFFGTPNGNPLPQPGTNGTSNEPISQYQYDQVVLKEENNGAMSTSPKSTSAAPSDNTPTTLTQFVLRPTYFRYLEEWGQNFCKERKKRLAQIYEDCRGNDKVCSGDGEDCEEVRKQDYSKISNFNCPGCGRECRKYKNWIKTKRTEFDEQKKAYVDRKDKYKTENKGAESKHHSISDQNFVKKLGTDYASIESFLEKLGSCSKNNKDNGDGTINFKEPDVTFKPADNCKPCSEFKVKCENGKCSGGGKKVNCNRKNTIAATEIANMINSTEGVFMTVSDNSDHKFEGGLEPCGSANIFKGIRKDVWKCGEYCGVDICEPNTFDGKQNGKEYIQIRALLKRWVEYFLEDYNKIKHKISHCMRKGEKTICINDCVEKWINIKKKEWETIRERYVKQYTTGHSDIYKVTSFLEDPQFHNEVLKAIKPCGDLDKFQNSTDCTVAGSSENGVTNKKDIVECLLENLKTKAKTCPNQANGENQTCDSLPHVEDDDDEEPLEETEENTVEQPNICPQLPKPPPQPGDEDGCKQASPAPSEGTENQPPVIKPEEEAPAPRTPRPRPKPPQEPQPYLPPALKNAMLSSTIMWSIGIVVLEPSGNNTTASGNNTTASGKNTPSDTQNDIPSGDTPNNKLTDNEWNTLKDEFISNMLQSEQPKDVPNDYSSGDIPFNTQPNTLYFDNNQEKPFITSIHDRDLYTGEEYNYNVNMSTNSMDDIPISGKNDVYSGIDLINDTLSGNHNVDIYDELLKRKENELFGTKHHTKHTNTYNVAKPARDDPLHNQLNLFHTWLDRHRNMCEKWKNDNERLAKLKEEWENDTSTSGNKHSDIPSGKLSDTPSDNNIHSDIHPSDIPSGKLSDIPSDNNIPSSNKTLNTDVSIQIDMNNPKTTNEFTYVDRNPNQVDDTYVDSNPDNSSMDTILEDLDKPFNEPYYYDMYDDDIYYDVHDHDTSTVDTNAMDVPSKVQIEMSVKNHKLVKEKYPIGDVWDI